MKTFKNYLTESAKDILNVAKKNKLQVIDNKYIGVWHGTPPATHKKILKTGKFKNFSWFGMNQETAKRFGQQSMSKGQPVTMLVFINADSLNFTGEYFTSKNKELKEIKPNIYE